MRKIHILILFLLPGLMHAQYGGTISTDRPGQALGTSAVGKKTIQIQTGINTNTLGYESDLRSRTILSNTVIRLGLFERLEINGMFNWQNDRNKFMDETTSTSGVSNTEVGARFNIRQNKGVIPALGLQGSLLLKAQSSDYQRDKLGSRIVLTSGNAINEWLSVATNLGVGWDGNGDGARSIYVLNFSFALTEKLSAVAEVYGSFNEFDANYDAGLGYLVNNNLLIDLSAGWQGDSQVSDWFIDAGISWRLDWRKENH